MKRNYKYIIAGSRREVYLYSINNNIKIENIQYIKKLSDAYGVEGKEILLIGSYEKLKERRDIIEYLTLHNCTFVDLTEVKDK